MVKKQQESGLKMTERNEKEWGLLITACVFAFTLYFQTNPIIKASLVSSIILLFCSTAFINWYIRLST